MRWELFKIDVGGLDDVIKVFFFNDIVGLDNIEFVFDIRGVVMDKLNLLRFDVWIEEGIEFGGRVDVRFVDIDCIGVGDIVDVEGLILRIELRIGDGCGSGLGCEGGVVVDIVGGVVMDRDVMDEIKFEMFEVMFFVFVWWNMN